MRLLALETSGLSGSVALFEPPAAPVVVPLNPAWRSARSLAPGIREVITAAGTSPDSIDVIGVAAGPGSFTGLRIGVTTAKTLAYALDADLVAVDTLDALAHQAPCDAATRRLHTVLDAHRRELFATWFEIDGGRWVRRQASGLIGVDAWLASLQPGDVVTGPVVDALLPRVPPGVAVVESSRRTPCAGAVAELAFALHEQGRRDDPFALAPWYGRLAAAEEKRQSTRDAQAP